jgi:hypothetical protein
MMMFRGFAVLAMALAFLGDPKSACDTTNTLGAPPPAGATVLFSGEDLKEWVQQDGTTPAKWSVKDGVMTVGAGNIRSKKTFGDIQLHLEFNIPYMPDAHGQARGNSGVYFGGIYELQVLDSYGLKLQDNDCGAIYKQIIPAVNACKPPLQWQTYDVTFHKAANGKKARITVLHNGMKTIDNAEIVLTPGGLDLREGEDGPILLQDHGNPVQYRNIWVKPLS